MKSIRESFSVALKRAGIEDFRPHDLRHTCGARLVNAGVSLAVIREILGHSTIKMTERYAHVAPDSVREGMARLAAASKYGLSARGEPGQISDNEQEEIA